MTKLMGLQFKIVYKKDKDNVVTDALSQVSHVLSISVVIEIQPLKVQGVLNSHVTDPKAQTLVQKLLITSLDEDGFWTRQGIIRRKNQIWVGENSALRTKLIDAMHESVLGGHSGVLPTYHRVNKSFWWHGFKSNVDQFVRQCVVCQQTKVEHLHPTGLLQPLPIPTRAQKDITMDFVEGLSKSDGSDTILVVVDRFTKSAHFLG